MVVEEGLLLLRISIVLQCLLILAISVACQWHVVGIQIWSWSLQIWMNGFIEQLTMTCGMQNKKNHKLLYILFLFRIISFKSIQTFLQN